MKSVCIVGMGETRRQFVAASLDPQGEDIIVNSDVWAINTMAQVIRCDRVIAMDDGELWRRVFGEPVRRRMARLGVPIYTSRPETHDWPNAVRYPIEQVLRHLQHPYLNNSVAFAVALALVEGYQQICLFGCDYNYDGDDARTHENGRPCVEFWLGFAAAKGVRVIVAGESTLLDSNRGGKLYGYPDDFDAHKTLTQPVEDNPHGPASVCSPVQPAKRCNTKVRANGNGRSPRKFQSAEHAGNARKVGARRQRGVGADVH